MTMTARDNYLSLVRRQGYERIPAGFNWCPHLEAEYRGRLDALLAQPDIDWTPEVDITGLPALPQDEAVFHPYYETLKPGYTIDVYGVAREPGSAAAMHMQHMRNPMAAFDSLEQMQAYPYPQFQKDAAKEARDRAACEALKASGKVAVGNMQCTIWETAWYMRGMMELMADMMDESPMAEYLLDWVTAQSIARAEYFMRTGADILFLGDDVGMQQTIMMSHTLYRTWIKPRLKAVIDAARAINPNVVVFYHSCGFVTPFIGDFIEAGVDVLNPVQPECMEFGEVFAQYGGAIGFHGTIGTQTTMPFGTPDEVRQTVWRNLDIAGQKGGLAPCPTHMLEPEVPWENIEAYIRACAEYTRKGC